MPTRPLRKSRYRDDEAASIFPLSTSGSKIHGYNNDTLRLYHLIGKAVEVALAAQNAAALMHLNAESILNRNFSLRI